MKRIIFTIFDDIKNSSKLETEFDPANALNVDTANSLLVKEYFDRLLDNKKEYAKTIGVEFKFFHNTMKDFNFDTDLEFTKVNLYKHHVMAELAKEYDEIMYVDMDVLFNTKENIFDEHNLSKGIHVKDQNEDIQRCEKEKVIFSILGNRSPALKYFITKDLLGGKENNVINTGVIIGRAEHILQIKFIERAKEAAKKIEALKKEHHIINKYYYPNNESIFSYILEKYDVPYVLLDESWHKIYDDKPEEGLTGKCIHFINKQFNRFFNDKTKAIFSLYIDIPIERLDNPAGYKDNPLSKSTITKNQLSKYKDRLIDNQKSYAKSVGADYFLFERNDEYEKFFCRFPDLSEYDVINLYKIYILEKLTKEYDLVMYADLDVYFKNNSSIFDVVPANYAICTIYDTKDDLNISNHPNYFKGYKKDFRNPEAKYWNAHALLVEDELDGDNNVHNTGIVVASKYVMDQLDYFSDIEETVEKMKELKEDEFSMYPENIRKSFGYDNETIFSYKINLNSVRTYRLSDSWHYRHYYENYKSMAYGTPQGKAASAKLNSTCDELNIAVIHFISKNFGLVFDK